MADTERAGVRRFVQVSSMGAGQPPQPGSGEVIAALLNKAGTRLQTLELTGGDAPVASAVHSTS